MELRVEVRDEVEAVVVSCEGRLVHVREAAVLSRAIAKLRGEQRAIIVDLTAVSAIDSGGVGCLAAAYVDALARGTAVKYCGLSARLARLLELCGLSQILELYEDKESALASCRCAA